MKIPTEPKYNIVKESKPKYLLFGLFLIILSITIFISTRGEKIETEMAGFEYFVEEPTVTIHADTCYMPILLQE